MYKEYLEDLSEKKLQKKQMVEDGGRTKSYFFEPSRRKFMKIMGEPTRTFIGKRQADKVTSTR